jgi:hypothetical protein
VQTRRAGSFDSGPCLLRRDTSIPRCTPTGDGSRDFDFHIGTWKTHLKRLVRPLTGSTIWVEMDGTTMVRPVWGGRANLVELDADGPGGHFRGLSLRLYNPETALGVLISRARQTERLLLQRSASSRTGAASSSIRKHSTDA